MRQFLRFRDVTAALLLVLIGAGAAEARELVLNPYEQVDWDAYEHHKAGLHVHTLQSDGWNMVRDVVNAYRDAGFTILALTDHDHVGPNWHMREGGRGEGQPGTYYPKGERPVEYPANTTWPWTDFGTKSPEELGMLGIEGAELSIHHHMNSFFTHYGARVDYRIAREVDTYLEDDQLLGVKATGGLAIMNHPGYDSAWWQRRPVAWYIERYEKHPADYLVGIEVTNARPSWEKYDEGLWDQILARLMPDRPVWGFGTDDMHHFYDYQQSHTVFVIDELSQDAVREAMERGQFYFTKSSRLADLSEPDDLDTFPEIHGIAVDEAAGTIEIEATGYDTIQWISAPASLEAVADYETDNAPWPLGEVVHEGERLDYRETEGIERYVRVELRRTETDDEGEEVVIRTFTNPFGFRE